MAYDPKDAKALYNEAGASRVVYNDEEERKVRAEGFTKPYEYREYPKSLYMGGDRSGAHRVVNDAAEEAAARNDGFKMLDKDQEARSLAALEKLADPEPKKAKK